MTAVPPAVIAENLTVGFAGSEMHELTLQWPRRSFVTLLGGTAAGKSVLTAALGGFLRPQSGLLRVWGENPYSLSSDLYPFWRRRVALCGKALPLLPQRSALDHLLYADRDVLRLPERDENAAETKILAQNRLERFGIAAEAEAGTLSEGLQSVLRVLITLHTGADVMLFDDPIRVCDRQLRLALQRILFDTACSGACIVLAANELEPCDFDRSGPVSFFRYTINDRRLIPHEEVAGAGY